MLNAQFEYNEFLTLVGYYDSLASVYDMATANGAWVPNDKLESELESLTGEVTTILDLGCGTGQTISTLKRHFPEASITGIDFSAEMLSRARCKFPTATFFLANIVDYLRVNRDHFNLIVAIGVLEFVPNLPEVMPCILDAATDNGSVILTYEPIIDGLEGQAEAASASSGNVIETDGQFSTYRWNPGEIMRQIERRGLRIDSSTLFVSYRRAGVPVIYHMLRASNKTTRTA